MVTVILANIKYHMLLVLKQMQQPIQSDMLCQLKGHSTQCCQKTVVPKQPRED